MTSIELAEKWSEKFKNVKLADTLKEIGLDAPVMTQRLGADPYAIVYEGRVYLYMTGDLLEYEDDGVTPKANTYQLINKINVVSSEDLVNWTDHGTVYAAGKDGAASWGNNSWAPAAAYKEINGKMKFFLYFANSGNGIGVVSADSPIGPFVDPINKALISRETPLCASVEWLFDPAVLMDDDGCAYIYFGGGVPGDKYAEPGTGRVAKLGADMISIEGNPVAIDIPYLFEDSGIHKMGDKYYYSYCTNFNVPEEATEKFGFENGEIAYMMSDSPMGPFTYTGSILKNPGYYYGCSGNNHHCIFEFKNEWYITYHSQILDEPLKSGGGYRCTHIAKLTINEDGTIAKIASADRSSLAQLKYIDPYKDVDATTMATMGGLNTIQEGEVSVKYGSGNMVLSDINDGDWLALYGVDFGTSGAYEFSASIKAAAGTTGAIEIRIDGLDGDVIGYLEVNETANGAFEEVTTQLLKKVTGVHDLVFIFCGEDYNVDYWRFS